MSPVEQTPGSVLLVVGASTGGIGVHASSLATGLPRWGWQVPVLTTPATAGRFDLGRDVHAVWPDHLGRSPARLLSMRTALRDEGLTADVVHAHGHQAGLLAVNLAGRGLVSRDGGGRPKVVVSWHNASLGTGVDRRARDLTERWLVRRADLITGASSDLVAHARSLGAQAAELAPVAAPAAGSFGGDRAVHRTDLAAELQVSADLPVVLTVSRVAPQKNLHVVLEASRLLAEQVPHVWLVVGDGDRQLTARLRSRLTELDAPVRLLGARSDVPRLMALADVFALASAWEARALVVQEAMAAGLPVVASRVGGLTDLLDGVGDLVEAGDARVLADAVQGVLTDPARAERMARAGRARFADLATEDDVLGAWDRTYRELLAGA